MDKEENNIQLTSVKNRQTSSKYANVYENDGFAGDSQATNTKEVQSDGDNSTAGRYKNVTEDVEKGETSRSERRGSENGSIVNGNKKEGSGSVDFSIPSALKARDRSRSIISLDGPYRGMGKEELLRYSSRPLWRNLRYACISVVLTGWLALLIMVVALVLTYPQCRAAERKDWWQKTVVYRIYVRSFSDTDRDGVGDLNGIIKHLDYLKDTGVGTISLSPIYKLAANAPGDEHVTNHTDIDAVFGSMEDFKRLVNGTHARGMHITLDFIPNHTSDEHPWFDKSKANSNKWENRYRSYYVWQHGPDANSLRPPNSWQSIYNCSAWKLGPDNSHVLHQFLPNQPDLNLRSEKVQEELENILKFWLDLGVDGFYIRDSDFLFEDYDLRDNTLQDNSSTVDCRNNNFHPYNAYSTEFTKGLDQNFDMLARWRAFLDDYSKKTSQKYKILLADVDAAIDHVMQFYGLFNRDGVDFPLNKFSLDLQGKGGKGVADMINNWLTKMPAGRWANWMGGDDRSARLVDRLGPEQSQPYMMLIMLLPGTPYIYYGDEIGISESVVNASRAGAGSREMPMRGPMLWNSHSTGGFCDEYCKEPWIPEDVNFKTINVETQKKDPYSMWNLIRNLTRLRRDFPSFEYGDFVQTVHDDHVFSFVREFDGEKGFLVALNFANASQSRHFTGTHSTIPSGAKIEVISGKTSRRQGHGIGLDPLTLERNQGVVVSWDYKAKEI